MSTSNSAPRVGLALYNVNLKSGVWASAGANLTPADPARRSVSSLTSTPLSSSPPAPKTLSHVSTFWLFPVVFSTIPTAPSAPPGVFVGTGTSLAGQSSTTPASSSEALSVYAALVPRININPILFISLFIPLFVSILFAIILRHGCYDHLPCLECDES